MENESKTRLKHVLGLSGGKDSAALAMYMRDKYPDIEIEYFFTDTGKELEETYKFLGKLEAYLGKPILKLNNGQDFDYFLSKYNNFLPSHRARWCTEKLKIAPFEKWAQKFADDGYKVYSYVAIRSDEDREGYRSNGSIFPKFPFVEDGVDKTDVLNILKDSGLGLPEYYQWRSRSGCYFCFFQRKIEWVKLKERHPFLYEQARKYEKGEFTWNQGESLTDLENPERVAQIKDDHEKRIVMFRQKKARIKNPLKPDVPIEDEDLYGSSKSCLVCHK